MTISRNVILHFKYTRQITPAKDAHSLTLLVAQIVQGPPQRSLMVAPDTLNSAHQQANAAIDPLAVSRGRTLRMASIRLDPEVGRIHLVTFADGSTRWRLAGSRLVRQAKASTWFQSAEIWTLERLLGTIPSFAHDNTKLDFYSTRGLGFWLWRPYILEYILSSMPRDSVLLFLDAGCQLNVSAASKQRFSSYIYQARRSGNLIMRIDQSLDRWCKGDLLAATGLLQRAADICLVEPGVFFLTNNEANMNLIKEWKHLGSTQSNHFIDDSASHVANAPGFQEHRHDQAILTCLGETFHLNSIPQETYYPDAWKSAGRLAPIWAMRNSTPFNLHSSDLLSLAVTALHKRARMG